MAKISGHMTYGGSPARMEGKMGKSKYDPLTPDLTTLCKLGSIVVHAEEMLSTGHAFDRAALQSLLIDPEVQRWIKAMGVYMPVKR